MFHFRDVDTGSRFSAYLLYTFVPWVRPASLFSYRFLGFETYDVTFCLFIIEVVGFCFLGF